MRVARNRHSFYRFVTAGFTLSFWSIPQVAEAHGPIGFIFLWSIYGFFWVFPFIVLYLALRSKDMEGRRLMFSIPYLCILGLWCGIRAFKLLSNDTGERSSGEWSLIVFFVSVLGFPILALALRYWWKPRSNSVSF